MAQLQSGFLITLSKAAGGDLGTYTMFGGGKITWGSVPDRAAGERFPTASGGDATIEAITIGRRIKRGRDTDAYRGELRKLGGVENGVIANVRAVDADGNPVEDGDTYLGTLTGFTPTGADTNSENEAATFEVEIQPSDVKP